MNKFSISHWFTLPRLLVIGACLCFIIEFSLHLAQLNHLKKFKETDFYKIGNFRYINLSKDNYRVELVQLCISFFFAVVSFLLIDFIWSKTNGNYMFLLVITIIEYVFTTIPVQCITRNIVYPKYQINQPFDKNFFGQSLIELFSGYLGQCLLILILNLFARCTHLERNPLENRSDEPAEENTREIDQLNPDQETDAPKPKKCIKVRFWFIVPFIAAVLLFFITAYLPDILMIEGEEAFKPISTSDPSKDIYNLSQKVGFPYDEIYVSYSVRDEGSPNAYFSGILSKKVMVTSTLLKVVDIKQATAVVGHELGHYKHNDIVISYFATLVMVVLYGAALYLIQKKTLSEFGLGEKMPVAVVLFVANGLFKPANLLYTPLRNVIMRSCENNADCFSAKLGLPIDTALSALFEAVGETFDSNTAYANFYNSHPQLKERLANIAQCKKQ